MVFDNRNLSNLHSQDFVLYLPPTLSEYIFTQLDVHSLCSSTQVSRSWNELISDSDYIWYILYKSMGGNELQCKMRNLSYKKLAVERYIMLQSKEKWLMGHFAFITSFEELENKSSFCVFSKNDWEEILQSELER